MNIDGGAAADPETGMIYVGGQSGLSTIEVAEGSVLRAPLQLSRTTAAASSARCRAAGGLRRPSRGRRARRRIRSARAATTIGGVSILKPKELGGITAYDMNTGDKKWWVPNGNSGASRRRTIRCSPA